MEALNEYQVTARSLKEVKKRLYIFMGCWNMCYDKETKFDWLNDPKNKCKITYYDKLCDMYRTDYVTPYGFKQGYFDIDKIIEELRAKKVVKIPFKTAYDIRQYIRNYDGCYMKIEVI